MKKISLFLAVIMLFGALLTSCGDSGTVSEGISEAISADESEAVSEQSSDISESSDSEESSEQSEESLPPETFEYANVISLGKPYTSDVKSGDAYTDSNNAELTDGIFVGDEETSYTENKLAGYAPGNKSAVSIVLDLGDDGNRLYQFEASYLCYNGAGIQAPSNIAVFGSNNGVEFDRIGKLNMGEYAEGHTAKAVLTLERSVKYRYIKFYVGKRGAWLFLDELSVIADVEGGASSASWEELLDQAYANEALTSAERDALIKKMSAGNYNAELSLISISKGKGYSVSSKYLPSYSDDGKLLTDGSEASFYDNKLWVGFDGSKDTEIVVNLLRSHDEIAAFSLHALNIQTGGICFPSVVTVYASEDNKTWNEVGRMYAPRDSKQTFHTYSLILDNCIKARYIKFKLANTSCRAMLIDEINVFKFGTEEARSGLYPQVVIPVIEKDEYWDKSEADYSSVIDLIAGFPQQISCASQPDASFFSNNSSVTSKILTDGDYSSSADIHNGKFFKFNHGSQRDIFYDLTKLSSVSSFAASFTNYTDWAVYSPGAVTVLASANGKDWYIVGSMQIKAENNACVAKGKLELKTPIAARYLAFSVEVKSWAGCDEIDVFGTKEITKNTVALKDSGLEKDSSFFANAYAAPSPDILGGVHDLYLAYHSATVERTVNDLLPIIAYTDTEGNIKDTLFDGVLFLMSGKFATNNDPNVQFTKSDAEWLLKTWFADGKNINALEEAAAQMNKALGTNEKVKFYVTLYRPHSDFGKIDGVTFGKNYTENALSVIEWFITRFESKLKECNFQNISFEGYYWYRESMDYDNGDLKLTQGIADIVHKHNSQFFWIPYYVARGYSMWQDNGFDVACMQPNYAFRLETPYSQLENTANLIKRYGMCVEIEISGEASTNNSFRQKYFEYLMGGVRYGYMKDCIHMYYLEMLTFVNMSKSKSKPVRYIYDKTYEFIKGTLQTVPAALSDMSFTASENTPLTKVLDANEDKLKFFKSAKSPLHGTVTIDENGTFTYYPDKGFKGTDSFTFTYNEMFEDSAETTVTIEVK